MPRYKLLIEYDGGGFSGWQRQADQPSVQQTVEEAVSRFYDTDERFLVQCAGRTDAGVHAVGQVAHVDLPHARDPHTIVGGLNFHMHSQQIAIRAAQLVHDGFNARFDAHKRYYRYRVINRRAPLVLDRFSAWHIPEPLDVEAMQQAAQLLIGEHDFSSFRDSQCQAKSPIKSIDRITLTQHGEEIITNLQAVSFLHHQVRIIMGSLRAVGNGKWSLADFQAAIDAKSRAAGGETAPPQGLTFMKVDYPQIVE